MLHSYGSSIITRDKMYQGGVVLLIDLKKKHSNWSLGLVMKVFLGRDNEIGVVEVKHCFCTFCSMFDPVGIKFMNKIAGRCGAPQASYGRRRHRNCFQTGPAQAFPKK